jgi:hypothetical protein
MGGGAGKAEIPGNEIPDDRPKQSSQDDIRIHDADVDETLTDGLGHRSADHKSRHKIEECGPEHCHSGTQDPGRNHCGNGVGTIMETVDEVEDERNRNDDQDVQEGMVHV